MKNLAAVLIILIGMIGLYLNVEFSGWVLLLGALAVGSCDW